MPVSTTDASKKSYSQDILNNMGSGREAAFNLVNSTSYSNKTTALDAIQDLVDALDAARTAVNNLA